VFSVSQTLEISFWILCRSRTWTWDSAQSIPTLLPVS